MRSTDIYSPHPTESHTSDSPRQLHLQSKVFDTLVESSYEPITASRAASPIDTANAEDSAVL